MSALIQADTDSSASDETALFRAFPVLRQRLAMARCTLLPTRTHRLEKLGRALGVGELWIKRDDETSPHYGGNKPRKLDFVLGDALARRARSVITFGGIGTHHGLATAIFARRFGLRCILGLVHQPVTAKVRHGLLLAQAYGAELHYRATAARLLPEMIRVYARELLRRQRPYFIPAGGSSLSGVLGFVNAALELREQVEAGALPEPDWIVAPVGTGGSLAGLTLGLKLAGLRSRVVGVLVNDIFPPNAGRIARLANRAHARLRRLAPDLPWVHVAAAEIALVRNHLGRGYGVPSEPARRARDELERLEGITAETTSTGKCLAALGDLVQQAPYRGGRILYWHTFSSAPAEDAVAPLPAYRDLPLDFHEFFHGPPVAD
jgi:D-cysteine desulfhydrase